MELASRLLPSSLVFSAPQVAAGRPLGHWCSEGAELATPAQPLDSTTPGGVAVPWVRRVLRGWRMASGRLGGGVARCPGSQKKT